ncbi:MAG: group II intron reverse transcriptase/maturase [Polaromonas sp.]
MGTRLQTPEKVRILQTKLNDKAKREPAFRFYLLYDKVYRQDILQHAYALRRSKGGAPGVDGIGFEDIERAGAEDWLRTLGAELQEGSYRAQPVRRVMIPKAGGGERPLGIPTVRDRVVQTAALLILEPIFEADFEANAYGYRPGRSAQDAVLDALAALQSGESDVVDADLSKYFDTIPHDKLMQSVARRISDGKMLHLIKMWLKAPVEETNERGRTRLTGGQQSSRGTPQGGVISPLLANLYIHRLLRAWTKFDLKERLGARIINYADDLVIVCRTQTGAQAAHVWLKAILERLGLQLNEQKTCIRDGRRESFDFLGYTFGPQRNRRTGRMYAGVTPSRKAIARARQTIQRLLRSGNQAPTSVVIARMNRSLIGWSNYFNLGTPRYAATAVDRYAFAQLRAFLVRRHKVPARGTRRFTWQHLHQTLGLVCLQERRRHVPLHALS